MQSTRTHPKQAATPPNMKGPAPGAGKSKENMEITSKAKEIFRRVRRVATVIVAIGLILSLSLTVFSSCASNKVTQAKLETVHSDTFVGDFAKNLSNRPVARQYFTAALNGYDMLADGFNDADLEAMKKDEKYYKPGENGVNMDAVRKVLLEKEADWHVRPTDAGEGYEKIVNGLTEQNAKDIGERMVTAIDLTNSGFMDTILRGIGVALKWISDHLAFHSYLFALFIFALALEIVMLPFGIRQQKNTIKQAKLRPKEMAIRNKYKGRNDQATLQKMQAEIQELYQKENYNQFSSCLPLLLQLPIIFVLYYIVIDPLHYMMWLSTGTSQALTTFATTARAAGGWGISLAANNRGTVEVFSHINAEFLDAFRNFSYYSNAGEAVASLNIADLPSFNIGSVNFGLVPSFGKPYALLVVPIVTFLAYFGSMKLTRKFTYQPPSAPGSAGRMLQQHHGHCHAALLGLDRVHRSCRSRHVLDLQEHSLDRQAVYSGTPHARSGLYGGGLQAGGKGNGRQGSEARSRSTTARRATRACVPCTTLTTRTLRTPRKRQNAAVRQRKSWRTTNVPWLPRRRRAPRKRLPQHA